MNKVDELLKKLYLDNGFVISDKTLNRDGTYSRIELEYYGAFGTHRITFEYVRLSGEWGVKSEFIRKGETNGSLMGSKALSNLKKVLKELEKADKEAQLRQMEE